MTTIYLVSAGSYSDYHIVAAFSTREMAEKIAKQENGRWDTCGVEEYELDASDWKEQLGQVKETDKGWRIWLDYNYESGKERLDVSQHGISTCLSYKDEVSFSDCPFYGKDDPRSQSWQMHTFVIAEAEEQATKVATDRFQGFIAKRALDGKPLTRAGSK